MAVKRESVGRFQSDGSGFRLQVTGKFGYHVRRTTRG